ncbi:MAG: bifunctional folylpolyglutamate synthase/dihydrofolate synthase [Chthoniobacterales bacterium]
MTNSDGVLAWLDSTQHFGIKLGLENTRRLLDAVGCPEKGLPFIHVAGTNGKGSTCAMIDSILRSAGFRCGLYTSPHLVDLRERFRVQGALISAPELARILNHIRSTTASWSHTPTFFEITTVAAMLFFQEQNVDIVILETGMGGRLDSTNVVTPVVSVITKIGLDHQQWLGESLAQIAGEKAGIIKPGVPVASAPQAPDAARVIAETAARVDAELVVASELDQRFATGLEGPHQRENAAVVIAALRAAHMDVPDAAIQSGLRNVQWPGRFQRIGNLWLDGAHNPDGVQALCETWKNQRLPERPIILFGALADKGAEEMLNHLREISDTIWLVPIQNARAADPNALATLIKRGGKTWANLDEALAATQQSGRPVLITGSLYLIGEAMAHLGITPFRD